METYQWQLAETILLIVIFFGVKLASKRIVNKVGAQFNYQLNRVKITQKIVDVLLMIALLVSFMFVWGVDQSDVLVFLSTMLTILGVAFFAQWSIISNITSTLIIFFNHPIKIGDHLTIMDKEYDIEGTLSDIGIFFITIKTKDGKKVTIPSNIFMQKVVRKDEQN